MQAGKTRWAHCHIAYHLVWIPTYRRKILTTEGEKATKELIAGCCERHGLPLLTLETDQDHVHVFVSAPPRLAPAAIANLLKGYSPRYLRERLPHRKRVWGKEHVWTQSYYRHGWGRLSRDHSTLHHGMPGEVKPTRKRVGSSRARLTTSFMPEIMEMV